MALENKPLSRGGWLVGEGRGGGKGWRRLEGVEINLAEGRRGDSRHIRRLNPIVDFLSQSGHICSQHEHNCPFGGIYRGVALKKSPKKGLGGSGALPRDWSHWRNWRKMHFICISGKLTIGSTVPAVIIFNREKSSVILILEHDSSSMEFEETSDSSCRLAFRNLHRLVSYRGRIYLEMV